MSFCPSYRRVCRVIAQQGFIYLKTPGEGFDYKAFLGRFGTFIRQYHDGIEWDLMADESVKDCRFSNGMRDIRFHTEYSQCAGLPPRLLALYCVHPAGCGGGALSLMDGYDLYRSLPQHLRRRLHTEPYLYFTPEGLRRLGYDESSCHRIAETYGNKLIIRMNMTSISDGDPALLQTFREKLTRFADGRTVDLRQEKGSLLLIDNFRMIHSRKNGFTDRKRHIKRLWIA